MDEDTAVLWQDALDEIVAGRPDGIACPFCTHKPLAVQRQARTTRISCPACKRFIEGNFTGA